MTELKSEYMQDFYKVKEYIEAHAKVCEKRNEAIEALHSIYLEAQENEAPLSEIHEGSPKEYAKEIVVGLPHIAPEKRKIIRRIFAAVLVAAFALLAFFTSDFWNLYKGGYNYYMKHFDRVSGARSFYSYDDHTVKLTYKDWNDPETYPELSELGIYFDKVKFSSGTGFDVFMRSETIQTSLTSYMNYKPYMTFGTAQYYRNFKLNEPVTAEIAGYKYEGELVICDATGRDLKYWISFEPAEEGAVYSKAKEAFENGEELVITFGEIDRESWRCPGFLELIAEGKLPFFVQYEVSEENWE